MKRNLILVVVALALTLGAGGAAATDYGYVPLGQYGEVTIASTRASVFPLTIKTPQNSYGALQTFDFEGRMGLWVGADGAIRVRRSSAPTPRLELDSQGYTGADVLTVNIGGTAVFSLGPNGQAEAYSYYHGSCCNYGQDPMLTVVGRHEEDLGGIDSAGRYFTQSIKPDGTIAPQPPNSSVMALGSAVVWFDPTPQTGGLMVTMKDSAGGVRTARVG